MTELESFVQKFQQLRKAGVTAHLDVDTHAGRAWVGLRVQLGQVPAGPVHQPFHRHPHQQRGPAYQRRQERRKAARASSTAELRSSDSDTMPTEKASDASEQVNDVAEEATDILPSEKENEAVQVSEFYECSLCDFKSNWDNGLNIHMARKHAEIEQLDGNSENDETTDEKYAGSRHYWAEGRLSTVYQTFLDANEIIDKSELDEEEKEKEHAKLLDARKTAFGAHFKHFPPWS